MQRIRSDSNDLHIYIYIYLNLNYVSLHVIIFEAYCGDMNLVF